MHNVEKRPNVLEESSGAHIVRAYGFEVCLAVFEC